MADNETELQEQSEEVAPVTEDEQALLDALEYARNRLGCRPVEVWVARRLRLLTPDELPRWTEEVLAMTARREGHTLEMIERTVHRQCDREFIEPLAEEIEAADAVLSMGCGSGVQMLAEVFPGARIHPALDTRFIGATIEAFDNDLPILGSIIGMVELGWYSGTIYGSMSGAKRHNHELREEKLGNLGRTFAFPILQMEF